MLKCKWSRLECFEICKERLWHCHYCVITVASHGSHCKGWGGDGERISKSQGLFLQTWDMRKKPDSISEDLRMLGDDKWMLTLKNAQGGNCNLSFIWGKMRTAAWETAPQIALRNSSKETRGKVSIYDLKLSFVIPEVRWFSKSPWGHYLLFPGPRPLRSLFFF